MEAGAGAVGVLLLGVAGGCWYKLRGAASADARGLVTVGEEEKRKAAAERKRRSEEREQLERDAAEKSAARDARRAAAAAGPRAPAPAAAPPPGVASLRPVSLDAAGAEPRPGGAVPATRSPNAAPTAGYSQWATVGRGQPAGHPPGVGESVRAGSHPPSAFPPKSRNTSAHLSKSARQPDGAAPMRADSGRRRRHLQPPTSPTHRSPSMRVVERGDDGDAPGAMGSTYSHQPRQASHPPDAITTPPMAGSGGFGGVGSRNSSAAPGGGAASQYRQFNPGGRGSGGGAVSLIADTAAGSPPPAPPISPSNLGSGSGGGKSGKRRRRVAAGRDEAGMSQSSSCGQRWSAAQDGEVRDLERKAQELTLRRNDFAHEVNDQLRYIQRELRPVDPPVGADPGGPAGSRPRRGATAAQAGRS